MKNIKKNIQKYTMPVIGLIILLANAIAYIFNLNFNRPSLTIMGLVFLVIGLRLARKIGQKAS